MNAMVKVEVMDWDRFSIEDWLKQYGAYIQISRMKSGHCLLYTSDAADE